MKILFSVISLISLLFVYGCKSYQQGMKSLKSFTIGVERTVTLYSASGAPIKTWNGRINIKDAGGGIRFIVDDKVITISGTYLVEEN